MQFRGLFVGIDRYESQDVNWLNCATRDAKALHALFSDTLGDTAQLLLDEQATRQAIEEQFNQLSNCDEDDVVIIAFSGHGSETHELVTYDADLNDLANSCIPLGTLTEWFSRIPAEKLICILDCCFSGEMGSKVLKVTTLSRNLHSVNQELDQLSGNGRLILTASSATEPAWENSQIGHGFLTYYLLQALQGAEEVRQAGKVSIYRLLEYVTQQVINAAAQLGEPQHPALRGQLDGELTWPIFKPGTIYFTAFPERRSRRVEADVKSLTNYGFPNSVMEAWSNSISTLNQLQMDAVNEFGVLEGNHLVVSAPTSSGKTMIGELAALKGALERKRTLFLLPLKALVNDKFQQFNRIYGEYGLKTIRATGEIADDIPDLMRGRYDICLMTYEKCTALLLGNPHLLNGVGTIVIDEVQMITDQSRGKNLEFLLTLLVLRRKTGLEPQLVVLSAVIGDTNGLEHWLGARLLRRNERPVPLNEGLIRGDGSFRFLTPEGEEKVIPCIRRENKKDSSQDWIIPLVRKLVQENNQVIVFREEKGETVGCARYLANALNLSPAQAALDLLPSGDPSNASADLRVTLQGGIAFHNADLDREERQIIEEHFRAPDTTLKVIVATTTLAMGVNTPASAVIVAGLVHPGPSPVPYSIAEYKNIIGRAGRLGFSEEGTSYLLSLNPQEEHRNWNTYVLGIPEDLQSQFLTPITDLRSLIIRVVTTSQQVSKQGMSAEEVIDFLEGSFGAYQAKRQTQSWQWDREKITRALNELISNKLIEQDSTGALFLTQLGRLAGEAGVEVETIIRFVEVLSSLMPSDITTATLITITQLAVELEDVYFPMNKRSTEKEPQSWRTELVGQNVPLSVLGFLHRRLKEQHIGTLRMKKAVVCLLWITNRPLNEIEIILTRHGITSRNVGGPIRSVSARTNDLLPTVTKVAELLHPGLDLSDRLTKLLVRLELGLPTNAVEIAKPLKNQINRGDYLRLVNSGLTSVEAMKNCSDEILLNCLDRSRSKLSTIKRILENYKDPETHSQSNGNVLPPPED